MQLPRYSVTALAVAVGGGVWYYQSVPEYQTRGLVSNSSVSDLAGGLSLSGGDLSSSRAAISGVSRQAHDSVDTKDELSPSGKTLIVDDDQFYIAEIQEDSPLVKEAEYQSRQVLSMLTPEQATQKLRRSEESILVGRGRGVVRYDVVQMPSNNPIEDDHREKIVEVSQSVTPAEEGLSSNDWMFWGVFDGHR
jgi:pyruvate dehydrogenase phosphatase